MIIGGLKFREQTFNWRSAGVSSALLFVSIVSVKLLECHTRWLYSNGSTRVTNLT